MRSGVKGQLIDSEALTDCRQKILPADERLNHNRLTKRFRQKYELHGRYHTVVENNGEQTGLKFAQSHHLDMPPPGAAL